MRFEEKYELVVGLEVHVQLLTRSKIFASDSNTVNESPNTILSPITLAHPGTLPRVNKHCVELAVRFGLAVGARIAPTLSFDRKNYFYPDLPKGYQLTQDNNPICVGGELEVPVQNGVLKVQLNRAHLEEDAGKSIHDQNDLYSLVDLNRAGVPLLEIVTDPVLRKASDAAAFLSELRRLVRFIGISDGNMQEGSIRCDANISVRPIGAADFGNRCEIKNMNSMRFLQKAIEYEFERQCGVLEGGGRVLRETRGYNANENRTYSLRTKEEANDYRYFPDPDLQPTPISPIWIDEIKSSMPELPLQRKRRLEESFALSDYDSNLVTQDISTANYFESTVQHGATPKSAANWLIGPIKNWLNTHNCELEQFPIAPQKLAELIQTVESGQIAHASAAEKLLPLLVENPTERVETLLASEGLAQSSDASEIETLAKQILTQWPDKVIAYKKGNKGLLGLFMGELMKQSNGKLNPKMASSVLLELLSK